MYKGKFITILSIILILLLVLSACEDKGETTNKKEDISNQEQQSGNEYQPSKTIKTGFYYNPDMTGEVAVFDDGTACYFPDYSVNEYKYGEYIFEDGILSIYVGKAYWKFALEGDKLFFVGYKYAGTVYNTIEENKVFTYSVEEKNVLRCGTYSNGDSSTIDVGSEGMTLTFDVGGNNRISGKSIIDGNTITFGDEENYAVVQLRDNKLFLLEYWYNGYYAQLAEGKEVYQFYNTKENHVNRDKKGELIEKTLESGTYHNEAATSELIIYDDGTARYCPNVGSSISFCGAYSVEDDMLVIREVRTEAVYEYNEELGMSGYTYNDVIISVNKFEITEAGYILREYIDYQDEIHTYDSEVVLKASDSNQLNMLRPGTYYNGEDKCISIDLNGRIALSLNLDREPDYENEIIYHILEGNYEKTGETIYVSDEAGNTASLILKDGGNVLEIEEYKFYEASHNEDNGILVFEYVYDEQPEFQWN